MPLCPTLLGLATVVALIGLTAGCTSPSTSSTPTSITERVGRGADNRTVTPVNQVLTPFGRTVELPGLRPQTLALSPDGRLLVTSGKTSEIVVIDPATGEL